MSPEQKLEALGLKLPILSVPTANYIYSKLAGQMLYCAGQDPIASDGTLQTGRVGRTITTAEAYLHARNVGLGLLAAMKQAAGDLARIEIVKVFGMVNAADDFCDHAAVIDGCSDLFVAVLGERGRHARSAVGMTSLPDRITVEIEAICRLTS